MTSPDQFRPELLPSIPIVTIAVNTEGGALLLIALTHAVGGPCGLAY